MLWTWATVFMTVRYDRRRPRRRYDKWRGESRRYTNRRRNRGSVSRGFGDNPPVFYSQPAPGALPAAVVTAITDEGFGPERLTAAAPAPRASLAEHTVASAPRKSATASDDLIGFIRRPPTFRHRNSNASSPIWATTFWRSDSAASQRLREQVGRTPAFSTRLVHTRPICFHQPNEPGHQLPVRHRFASIPQTEPSTALVGIVAHASICRHRFRAVAYR